MVRGGRRRGKKNLGPATFDATKGKQDKDNGEHAAGFIFICNREMKSEWFDLRVFGLSAEKMNVVMKIKPGTTLFLYDTDLKRLYGIYEATSSGEYNLEPVAFGGNFPAQVRFEISRDCLPLCDGYLVDTIPMELKCGSFNPVLSSEQVKRLMSRFQLRTGAFQMLDVAQPQDPLPVTLFPVSDNRFQPPTVVLRPANMP